MKEYSLIEHLNNMLFIKDEQGLLYNLALKEQAEEIVQTLNTLTQENRMLKIDNKLLRKEIDDIQKHIDISDISDQTISLKGK